MVCLYLGGFTCQMYCGCVYWRWKRIRTGKNRPNQKPGFAKNRNEPESKKNVQEPEPNPTPQRTKESEPNVMVLSRFFR